jgi:hypothetical protein
MMPMSYRLAPDVKLAFGFDFLQPSWSHDSFRELLPGGTAALFPGLDVDTSIDSEFGLAPRLSVNLGLNSDYGVSIAGDYVSLTGSLRETVGSGVDNQSVDANTSINLLTIIGPEVTHRCQWEYLALETTLGLRYSTLNQNFLASLRTGAGDSVTTSSFHDYRGIGLTGSLGADYPLIGGLSLYGLSRGSLLVGRSDRQSNFAVVIPGGVGTASETLSESETEVLPVGDFEAGIAWNKQLRDLASAKAMMWLKVGYVATIWGDSSLLAAGSGAEFRSGSMVLQGFTLQAGVAR